MITDKTPDANPLRYLFAKTWHYSAGNRWKVVLYWLMFVVANSIFLLGQPFAMAKVMSILQKDGVTSENFPFLLGLLALTLGLEVAFWMFHGPARCIERANAFKARLNYRMHLLKGVMTLPMEWHVEHHSGDTIDKMEKGTSALYRFAEDSFEVIHAFVKLIVSFTVLACFSLTAAGIILVMMLVVMWVVMRFDRVMIAQYQDLNRAENRVSESTFDAIGNITTVIILRVERLVFKAIVHKMEKPKELFRKNQRLNEIKWFLTNMCCRAMFIIVLGMYFYKSIGTPQGILVGSVYLLIKYLENISELFTRFTSMYGDILQGKAKVMNSEELAKDFRAESFSNHILPENWGNLEIKHLNFSYYGDGHPHLRDICVSMRRGERIALVGESGSGKTTFLKIVRDLHDPQSIRLSVDGRPIPQGFEGISRAIALVPQNPEIFATSILENITLGAEYGMDCVERFTDMACITEVIKALPRGFNSLTREKGVNLSGGQQQRLALARGLLACDNKDIVLLDEPTSNVDTANEMKIYRNIFREFAGKTIISSIHRLHLLPFFETIHLFHEGRIVISGSLQDLLSTSPLFQDLWRQYNQQKEGMAV